MFEFDYFILSLLFDWLLTSIVLLSSMIMMLDVFILDAHADAHHLL